MKIVEVENLNVPRSLGRIEANEIPRGVQMSYIKIFCDYIQKARHIDGELRDL
jgi:hypothetical protein